MYIDIDSHCLLYFLETNYSCHRTTKIDEYRSVFWGNLPFLFYPLVCTTAYVGFHLVFISNGNLQGSLARHAYTSCPPLPQRLLQMHQTIQKIPTPTSRGSSPPQPIRGSSLRYSSSTRAGIRIDAVARMEEVVACSQSECLDDTMHTTDATIPSPFRQETFVIPFA